MPEFLTYDLGYWERERVFMSIIWLMRLLTDLGQLLPWVVYKPLVVIQHNLHVPKNTNFHLKQIIIRQIWSRLGIYIIFFPKIWWGENFWNKYNMVYIWIFFLNKIHTRWLNHINGCEMIKCTMHENHVMIRNWFNL